MTITTTNVFKANQETYFRVKKQDYVEKLQIMSFISLEV